MIRNSIITKIFIESLDWWKLNIISNKNGSMSGINHTRNPALKELRVRIILELRWHHGF